jgi:Xaa-Pro aminopeptidase
MLSRARIVKSEEGIENMRKAAGIVEEGVKVGREFIRESITEKEISIEDDVLVTAGGRETLTTLGKELVQI